jgi:hypothetical protein
MPQPCPPHPATPRLATSRFSASVSQILRPSLTTCFSTPPLIPLNSESQEPGDLGAATAHAATTAAHLWARPRELDHSIEIVKTPESLCSHPVVLPTAADDRVELLHPARFLGGKKLWLAARDIICLEGVVPLSSYDMTTVGLGGCGWVEIPTRPPPVFP